MIGLWTRAAQARCLCNCSACLAATGRLAQRTNHSSLRQRIGRPDAFTVFSSTLAFSAAIGDGIKKDRSLQGWDRIIAETRAEIEAVEQEQEKRLSKLTALATDQSNDPELQSKEQWPSLSQTTWSEVLDWAENQEKHRAAAGFREWKGIRLKTLQNLRESDLKRILLDKRLLHRFYRGPDCSNLESAPHTHVYSTKKLRTLEWSMVKLVVRLLRQCDVCDGQENTLSDLAQYLAQFTRSADGNRLHPDITWEHILVDMETVDTRLQTLQSEPMASPLYDTFPSPHLLKFQFSPSNCKEALIDLNLALQDALDSTHSVTDSSLSTICKLLLESDTAPDIHTYNLLLIRFCQLGAEPLVDATFESLRETHMRPNEITHATLLRYFAQTKNKAEFALYVQRMNGFQRGLTLAHPNQNIDPLVASRYRLFGTAKTRIVELAVLNGEVYTCLIRGLLEMFQYGEAAWYYANMIREGWQPSLELLSTLLKYCCETDDIASGWRVWKTMLDSQPAGQHISRKAHETMLELCKKTGNIRMHDMIMREGRDCGALPMANADAAKAEEYSEDGSRGHTFVVATATARLVTVAELQIQYPYVPTGVIREKLQEASALAARTYEPIRAPEDISRFAYKTLGQAFWKPSFNDAQTFIDGYDAIPVALRQAMIHEIRWVFPLKQELLALNQIQADRGEDQHKDEPSLGSFETLHEEYASLSDDEHLGASSNATNSALDILVAKIQGANEQLTPRLIHKAYTRFRKARTEQERKAAKHAPSPLQSWPSTTTHAAGANSTWTRQPMRAVQIEAG